MAHEAFVRPPDGRGIGDVAYQGLKSLADIARPPDAGSALSRGIGICTTVARL